MSRRVEFDTSELKALTADLSAGPGRMQRRAVKVFEVAANKIKAGMREDASGHAYLGRLAYAVNYDRTGLLDYEIGFDKQGQGNLANIVVYGSVNNAPVFDHTNSLRREVPHMVRNLADEAEDAAVEGKR